jgi:hypothetical protein
MIATRFMELRKRRGLMIAMILVNIGIPATFLLIRLLAHAFAPKSYGPAGGYGIFVILTCGLMFIFGFIVAATVGCTAGSVDLTEGVFRHLVVTGRSRLALYLARIPAGLAIVVPLVAIGFTVVCAVCVFAAPAKLSYDGINVPVGLSRTGFDNVASDHAKQVICAFPYQGPLTVDIPCGPNGPTGGNAGTIIHGVPTQATPAMVRAQAVKIAKQNYPGYAATFLYPSDSLMIKTGLWIELEATIGFMVGLGLASLMGQRTVPVILMIVLELILTPSLSTHLISHLLNLQRGIVGLAVAHLEPGGLPLPFLGEAGGGGGPGASRLVPESTTVAVWVVVGWIVAWTAIGAWRMMTRDA